MWYVYGLVNKVDGKAYIGMTKDLDGRIKKHKTNLKTKNHEVNWKLWADYREVGWEGFDVVVLEESESRDYIVCREWFYMWTWSAGVYNVKMGMPNYSVGGWYELMCKWAKEHGIDLGGR